MSMLTMFFVPIWTKVDTATLHTYTMYLAMKNETKLLPVVAGQYKLGFILPAIAIVSNLIASRLIKRDEKLVRSVDRIR